MKFISERRNTTAPMLLFFIGLLPLFPLGASLFGNRGSHALVEGARYKKMESATALSPAQASARCIADSGNLASIPDAAAWATMQSDLGWGGGIIKRFSFPHTYSVMGAHRVPGKIWKWDLGPPAVRSTVFYDADTGSCQTYCKWKPATILSPKPAQPDDGGDAYLVMDKYGRWFDEFKNSNPHKQFICEYASVACTSAANCNNRATSVSGDTNSGCTCTCGAQWTGNACQNCAAKYNQATCASCASGYESYPNCYRTCTDATDCSNHGTASGNVNTPCTCSCRNQWGGGTCGTCSALFSGSTDCNACSSTRDPSTYPTCHLLCTTSTNCNSHATAVSGNTNSGCTCTCRKQWGGGTCNTCDSKYNSGDDCGSCSALYEDYSNCYLKCTSSANCNSRASSVSGNIVAGCSCTCVNQWHGGQCQTCATKHKASANCGECSALYDQTTYPTCHLLCTTSANCNSQATAVSGNINGGCSCTCRNEWSSSACNICLPKYDTGNDCGSCSALYEDYPNCYLTCTTGGHCNGHADSVTGNVNTGCVCTCSKGYDGSACNRCADGYAQERYPDCATLTVTLSESLSVSVSVSSTGSPSPSLTPTESDSATSSLSASRSVSPSQTDSPSASSTLSESYSASTSQSASVSVSKSLTQTTTITPPPSVSSTFTPSTSSTQSVSTSSSPTLSASPSVTASATASGSPSVTQRTASLTLHHAWLNITNETSQIQVSEILSVEPLDENSVENHLLVLQITVGGGESFDYHGITNSEPATQRRGFEQQQLVGGLDMSHCLKFTVDDPLLREYATPGNVSAWSYNDTTMYVRFGRLPLNQSSEIAAMEADREAELLVMPHCLAQRKPTTPVNFTFVKPPPPKKKHIIPPVLATTTKVVQGARAIPGVAAFAARSSLVLTLIECEPDWYDQLDRMQNIFGVGFGDPKYAQYVGTAIMNQVFMLGVGGFHLLWAFIYMKKYRCTWSHATARVRCPSLTLIPLLIALEPTAMAAVVTIIYGDGAGVKFVGVVSISLCYAYVIGGFIYLRKTWDAKFIPGENPNHAGRARHRTAIEDDDDPLRHEAKRKTAGRKFYLWMGYFIDGGVAWKDNDPENNKGYARRNRLLFMDFNDVFYWFLSVELMICVICGTLDGIKMGIYQCNGIVITMLVMLLAYFIAIIKYRPYNAPFLLFFSIALTAIQLGAVICMMIAMFNGGEHWQTYAENITLLALYIIIGRAIFDIAPKLKQSIATLVRGCFRKKEAAGQNQDLTLQLLEAVRDDQNNVEMQVQEVESNHDEAELELPEFDVEEEPEEEVPEEEEEINDEDIFGIAPVDLSGQYDDRGNGRRGSAYNAFDEEMERLLAGAEEHEGKLKSEAKAKRMADLEAARELRSQTAENAAAIKRGLVDTLGVAPISAAVVEKKPSKLNLKAGGPSTTTRENENTENEAEPKEEERKQRESQVHENNPLGGKKNSKGVLSVPLATTGDAELDALLDDLYEQPLLSRSGSPKKKLSSTAGTVTCPTGDPAEDKEEDELSEDVLAARAAKNRNIFLTSLKQDAREAPPPPGAQSMKKKSKELSPDNSSVFGEAHTSGSGSSEPAVPAPAPVVHSEETSKAAMDDLLADLDLLDGGEDDNDVGEETRSYQNSLEPDEDDVVLDTNELDELLAQVGEEDEDPGEAARLAAL